MKRYWFQLLTSNYDELNVCIPDGSSKISATNLAFKITRSTLDRALKYKGNSARDNMLRKAAFQRGGVIYLGITAPKGYLPDVDTTFENGCMRQRFGRRIEVVVHLGSNRTTIHIDGQRVASFDDLTVSTWGNMLYSLQLIYNRLADPHPAYTPKAKHAEAKVRAAIQ